MAIIYISFVLLTPPEFFSEPEKQKGVVSDTLLLRLLGWKMGLTALCLSFPSACRGGATKHHSAISYCVTSFVLLAPLYASIQGARKTKGVDTDTLLLRLLGWKMGFEPTTLGTTILYSNRLSYIHHNRLVFRIGVQIYTLFSIMQNFRVIFLSRNTLVC